MCQSFSHRTVKIFRAGILAPSVRGNRLRVLIYIAQELRTCHPAPANRGVHDLQHSPMPPPDDDEVRKTARQAHHDDARQRLRTLAEQVVERQDDLLGIEAELIGNGLHGVDGGAIDAGLAGFAEAAVTGTLAEAFEQAFERSRPAIQVRTLDHFGREEFPQCAPITAPAERSSS
jgi:hypothetical protein